MTTPAQIISRAFETIAPLKLAEKWAGITLAPPHVGLILGVDIEAPIPRQNANKILLTIDLTSAVVEDLEAISTRTAAAISYHPPIFKSLSSFTLENPLQKSLLLCAAQGISVFSPHTALDRAKGGINDWLSAIVQTAAPGSVEYVGAPKEDDLGGEGRLVRFEQPVGLDSLLNVIKKGLALTSVQVGRSPRPRSDGVTSVAVWAGSGGSLLGLDPDVYFTVEMSHHEVLAAVASGRHVDLWGQTNTEREKVEVHISTEDRHPLDIV